MKYAIAFLIALGLTGSASAWDNNDRQYKDVYGHSYKNATTLNKDTDNDGISNRYDYNDRVSNQSDVGYKWQNESTKQSSDYRYGW